MCTHNQFDIFINDGLTVQDFLENDPMARGKTWPVKTENGLNYKESKKDNSDRKTDREGVEERVHHTIFDWCHLFQWTIQHDLQVKYRQLVVPSKKGTCSCIIDVSTNIQDDGDILVST